MFNEKQLKAIELLARAEYEGLTQSQVALKVGTTDRTIRRWMADKEFKDAVGRKSLELITELSPMVFKATADFLQSKDDRVRSKGVDTFLKASEKIEQLQKQDEAQKEAVDVDAFLESIGIKSFETAKNKERYLEKSIHESKERICWIISGILLDKYRLELLKTGASIEDIEYKCKSFVASPEAVAGIVNEVMEHEGIVVMTKTEYDSLVPEEIRD
ncbi:phBC6A51 family helix-turn-helix protein [Clostridium sporogenes]|uniref:phBC6A51 family helix-turn-helix protein n=1 Tax=Clostridium sporogenes TaxID=1509 RepID=UPI00313B2600